MTLELSSSRLCGMNILRGKLDWVMVRDGLRVVARDIGNDDFSLSDHKWLIVDVSVEAEEP